MRTAYKSLKQWCVENGKEHLINEWMYEKNKSLGFYIDKVSYASHKNVWWKCPICGSEYQAIIKNRKNGSGCRKCSYKTISYKLSKRDIKNSFGSKYPELLKEWDYERNFEDPYSIAPLSEKKVWWICDKRHSYQQRIYERVSKGNGCPYCSGHKVLAGFNDLQTMKPDLAKEWHPTKNGKLKPTDVTQNSNKKVWWMCENGHEWRAMINNRNRLNRGCPFCSGKNVIKGSTDLETTHPELVKEWDYEKNNGLMPSDVSAGSNKNVWWKCVKYGHSWQSKVCNRTILDRGCPYCSNQKLLVGFNDLETLHPGLAKEWDYERNGNLKPSDVLGGGNIYAWWKCSEFDHSYRSSIHNRIAGTGCPYCANQKLLKGFNDLATTDPELVKEWDYEKNGELKPSDIIGGHRKVWWICKNQHHYYASVSSRRAGVGCSVCAKHMKTSFPEQAIFYYIKQVFPDAINGYKADFLGRMELDIYVPSIKTAIEYDGKVFHTTTKSQLKDSRKYKLCKENGITLIRIRESAYYNPLYIEYDHKLDIPDTSDDSLNWVINNLCYHLGKRIMPDVNRDRNEIVALLDKRKTNLKNENPELAKEWDYEKNYPLVPENFAPNSDQSVWWKCSKYGHSWKAKISNRSHGKGCPECAKLFISYVKYDLASYYPEIAKDWDYEKNYPLTPELVGSKSSKVVYWKCAKCGYEWQSKVETRTRGFDKCKRCKKIVKKRL